MKLIQNIISYSFNHVNLTKIIGTYKTDQKCCCIALQSVLIEQTSILIECNRGFRRSQRSSINPEDYLQNINKKKNQKCSVRDSLA